MVASATSATREFDNINPNLIATDHKNSEALLEAISNRIRFSSNFNRGMGSETQEGEAQNSNFWRMRGPNLASIIADVEAATKI